MGLFKRFVSQTRKPEGFLGKLMVRSMNGGHAALADWGMSCLNGLSPAAVVELGCGGGRNAGALLKRFPKAQVTAVDYSEVSVRQATEYNLAAVQTGRCAVKQGDVSALALPDAAFDLATAFETVYFWPGLERCFAEVCRVLRPEGHFLIVNESDGTDETGKKFERIIDGMRCYTEEELKTALLGAGFARARVERRPDRPWLAVLAEKGP